jgi:hypothetical protein
MSPPWLSGCTTVEWEAIRTTALGTHARMPGRSVQTGEPRVLHTYDIRHTAAKPEKKEPVTSTGSAGCLP